MKAYEKNRQCQGKSHALLMVGLWIPQKWHSQEWPHTESMSRMRNGRCDQKLWDSKPSQGIMVETTLGVISWGCATAWGSVIETDPRYMHLVTQIRLTDVDWYSALYCYAWQCIYECQDLFDAWGSASKSTAQPLVGLNKSTTISNSHQYLVTEYSHFF